MDSIHSYTTISLTTCCSLVIALIMLTAEEEEEAEVEVMNVTNVVKSGISLVHALRVDLVEEGTVHLVIATVHRRLGKVFSSFTECFGSLSAE